MFSLLCFQLKDITKIVRLFLGAVSIKGLMTHSCLQRPKKPDYFGDIHSTKALFGIYLMEKSLPKPIQQISFKNYENMCFIFGLDSKVLNMQKIFIVINLTMNLLMTRQQVST